MTPLMRVKWPQWVPRLFLAIYRGGPHVHSIEITIGLKGPTNLLELSKKNIAMKFEPSCLFFAHKNRAVDFLGQTTLPETNSSPLKIGRAPKGNESSSNHPFSGAFAVSFMEGNCDVELFPIEDQVVSPTWTYLRSVGPFCQSVFQWSDMGPAPINGQK